MRIQVKIHEIKIKDKSTFDKSEEKVVSFDWDRETITKDELLAAIAKSQNYNLLDTCFVSRLDIEPGYFEKLKNTESQSEKAAMLDIIDALGDMRPGNLGFVLCRMKLPYVCLNKKEYETIYGIEQPKPKIQTNNTSGFFNHPIVTTAMTAATLVKDAFMKCCDPNTRPQKKA